MNDRFMDENPGGIEDYEYAMMHLIVTKVIKVPPNEGGNTTNSVVEEAGYIDGVTDDLYNSVSVKLDEMSPGKYLVFYTANFNSRQLHRRLNLIFYGPRTV